MSEKEILKKIREILEEEIEKETEFFRFSEQNRELFGKVVDFREIETDWGKREVVDIETEDGEVVSVLLGNIVLRNLFQRHKPKRGDYVLIRYVGWVEKEDGTGYKNFKMRVFRKEDVDKLIGEERAREVEELRPREVEKPKAIEKLREIGKPKVVKIEERVKEVEIPREELERIKDFVRDLMKYYTSISVDDLKLFIYKAGYEIDESKIPFDKLLEYCGLVRVGDRVMRVSDAERFKRASEKIPRH